MMVAKVAVVGSGVSGLAATWLLNKYSTYEVHLYEADSRPGGHANTVSFVPPEKYSTNPVDVDTGFIVLNPSTYPNFLHFLRLNDVPLLPTEMTFSVSRDRGLFEWAGNNLITVFCQPSRLLDAKMWRLLYDVLRFNACARRLIVGWSKESNVQDISIGQYLQQNNYSATFRDNYLIPMTAAVWSTPPDKCALDFPARTLIQFLNNHYLLQLTGKPEWLTVKGGSRVYVNKILSTLPKDCLHLSTPIRSVRTLSSDSPQTVEIGTADGYATYDHVILACHSDTALSVLRAGGGLTADEERILSRFQWNKNEVVLHSDINLMPERRLAWACWNYLTSSTIDSKGNRKTNGDQVALTYWMNKLQHIPEKKHGPVLVTLNPPVPPRGDYVAGCWSYDHPNLNSKAVLSQKEMPQIQNTRGISYAGAYLRYGFHEDGFTSGLRAAVDHLHVRPPFDIADPDREPGALWAAYVFDALEMSETRAFVGFFLTLLLSIIRVLFGTFLDLRHLDQ